MFVLCDVESMILCLGFSYNVMGMKITHPRTEHLRFDIKTPYLSVISSRMMFGEVVGFVRITLLLIHLELTLIGSVSEPVKPHVDSFRLFWHQLFSQNTISRCVINFE